MKGLALAVVGLWVITQTTFGPLATKLGLITSSTPTPQNKGGVTTQPTIGGGKVTTGGEGTPPPGAPPGFAPVTGGPGEVTGG